MSKSVSGAEQFVRELEALLHTARAAAATTLLAEADPFNNGVAHGPSDRSPRLSLFSVATESRSGTERVTVQLQKGRALYEGAASAVDFAESRLHVAARATLAAITEWAGDDQEFGLGEVVQVSLQCGPAVLVTVAVRSAWTPALPHSAGAPGNFHHAQSPHRWLIGSALQRQDAAEAAVRAVLEALGTSGNFAG